MLATVDLYWLPLGAGGHSVRVNGKLYELVAAALARRRRRDLYHSALVITVPEGRFVVEEAPARPVPTQRGVVAQGPVGTRLLGRLRLFRYEIRCWPGGVIPDVDEAVESPTRLSEDLTLAQRALQVVANVPKAVWGRDELETGEMWNSNSIIAWTLMRAGIDASAVRPPAGGRAPGWRAGLVAAERLDRNSAEVGGIRAGVPVGARRARPVAVRRKRSASA